MDDLTNPLAPPTSSGWDYAPETVPAILMATNLQRNAWVAEIGAGSGIFTQHLIGRFKHILAVESDPTQREMAIQRLGHFSSFCSIEGNSESTNWYDDSVDLVVSAQVVNRFWSEASHKEFRRILRSPAWFAFVNNYSTDSSLNATLRQTFSQELLSTFLPASPLEETLVCSYYSHHRYARMAFPLHISISRSQFLGHLLHASSRIKQTSHQQDDLASEALQLFNIFEIHGQIRLQMRTEVYVGKL